MQRGTGSRRRLILLAVAVLAVGTVCAAPLVGVERVPLEAVWSGRADPPRHDIFWKIRVPRVALGFLAGAGLAAAGMAFQAMFRNPLATPYTLGVAGGASLGATVTIYAGWSCAPWGVPATSIGALAGAGVSIALVYALSNIWTRKRLHDVPPLPLACLILAISAAVLLPAVVSTEPVPTEKLPWAIAAVRELPPCERPLVDLLPGRVQPNDTAAW